MIVSDWLDATPPEPAQLIYMDPPYMSQRDYGDFDDRWEDRDHYLGWMKPRLERCREWLREDGSFVLHVDPTMSHYLKVLCDTLFPVFVNEIIWCYGGAGIHTKRFPRHHDSLLFFAVNPKQHKFFPVLTPLKQKTVKSYNREDSRGRYKIWKKNGKEYRDYLPDKGKKMPDWWTDIPSFTTASNSKERVGYRTQKPKALLSRIIAATTREGDLVVGPMCGSGTTLVAAKTLGRRWWGCDINPRAIELAENRIGAFL